MRKGEGDTDVILSLKCQCLKLKEYHQTNGVDIVLLAITLASSPLSSSSIIVVILTSRTGLWPVLKPAKVLFDGCKDLGFSPHGEHWRQLRKICAFHLLSSTRVQSYRLIRQEEVGFMIRKISSQASPTTSVDMSEIFYSFANDMLCRVVSRKFNREEGRNVVFGELIREFSVLLGKFYVGDYFPWLGWLDVLFGSMERTKKTKKRWDDLVDGVIQEHEDRSAEGDDGERDYVDVLLSLREDRGGNHALLTPQTIKALLMV
ncbi:cytochrome P450 71A1-like [Musa acuminata AAA Group]|uniref:cytochrome P450 71A1-like n=1 Tax=Musa acuminata AAA Group TaxID=214697 RepID=UPI0031D4BA02